MARAAAPSGVAVKVLVERNQISPIGIVVEQFAIAKNRPLAIFVAQENVRQTPRQFLPHFRQVFHLAGARGTFNLERVAVVQVIFLKRQQDKNIHRHPDGTTPVRVPAEQVGGGLARLIVQPILLARQVENQRMLEVIAGDRPHTVGRKEFVFVQHVTQHAPQLVGPHQSQDHSVGRSGDHHGLNTVN